MAHPAIVMADGLEVLQVQPGIGMEIRQHVGSAIFWHSTQDYDYLETLRAKLGWHGGA